MWIREAKGQNRSKDKKEMLTLVAGGDWTKGKRLRENRQNRKLGHSHLRSICHLRLHVGVSAMFFFFPFLISFFFWHATAKKGQSRIVNDCINHRGYIKREVSRHGAGHAVWEGTEGMECVSGIILMKPLSI